MVKILRFFSLLFAFVIFFNKGISAQEMTLHGFVYDESNGEALIGANIYLKELGIGSSTNVSGYFVIPNVAKGEHTLICSYIGYETFAESIIGFK